MSQEVTDAFATIDAENAFLARVKQLDSQRAQSDMFELLRAELDKARRVMPSVPAGEGAWLKPDPLA